MVHGSFILWQPDLAGDWHCRYHYTVCTFDWCVWTWSCQYWAQVQWLIICISHLLFNKYVDHHSFDVALSWYLLCFHNFVYYYGFSYSLIGLEAALNYLDILSLLYLDTWYLLRALCCLESLENAWHFQVVWLKASNSSIQCSQLKLLEVFETSSSTFKHGQASQELLN